MNQKTLKGVLVGFLWLGVAGSAGAMASSEIASQMKADESGAMKSSAPATESSASTKEEEGLNAEQVQKYATQVNDYLNGFSTLSCLFQQDVYPPKGQAQRFLGALLMRQTQTGPQLQMTFVDLPQKVVIRDRYLYVTNLKTGKISPNRLSNTPVAHIFASKVDILKHFPKTTMHLELVEAEEGGKKTQRIRVHLTSDFQSMYDFELIFMLYENGNISALDGWTTRDPQGNVIVVEFLPKSLHLNTKLEGESLFEPKPSPSKTKNSDGNEKEFKHRLFYNHEQDKTKMNE